MKPHRREFIRRSALTAEGVIIAAAYLKNMISNSLNERVNVAVVGISGKRTLVRGMIPGRGRVHINTYAAIPNVTVKTICNTDERLFPGVVATMEKLFGTKSKTELDFRKVLDDKDIHVISIATPNHWHALAWIWAMQAGKHVSVEKPCCYNFFERKFLV
jgi:predicted dehydrogenase